MRWTLLTNDDGVESPALVPFARALAVRGEVRAVVPNRERSWIGKAITRFDGVGVSEVIRDGVRIATCTGYPADAVQLGIHQLFAEPPELVVSGINIGRNHGAAFVASSGTVGAVAEAWAAGVRGIAFSTGGPMGGDYDEWKASVLAPEGADTWVRLGEVCAGLVDPILQSGIFDVADIVNVNLPADAEPGMGMRVTSVARARYSALHALPVDGWADFGFDGTLIPRGELAGTDVEAAYDRVVSVTPLLMPTSAKVPDAVRQAIESP